jgi:outer membrane protein OmpA-like peptidoglycan-associated protein
MVKCRGIRHDILVCALFGALLALGAGCANTSWTYETIRDMNRPIEARVGQLETTTAAEKTRLDALTGRVEQVAGQTAEARRAADGAASAAADARQRADAAAAAAQAVDGRLTRVLGNRLKRNKVQAVDVHFKSGKYDISTQDQAALQGVVQQLAQNPTYTADVVGFTDKRGTKGYNVNLSWRREEEIRRFLVEKGADLNRFFFIGLGEDVATGATAAAEAKDRRATVQVYSPAD